MARGGAASEPLRIVPYDPGWPLDFERERARLAAVKRQLAAHFSATGLAPRQACADAKAGLKREAIEEPLRLGYPTAGSLDPT